MTSRGPASGLTFACGRCTRRATTGRCLALKETRSTWTSTGIVTKSGEAIPADEVALADSRAEFSGGKAGRSEPKVRTQKAVWRPSRCDAVRP
jgi:hypothetical protein